MVDIKTVFSITIKIRETLDKLFLNRIDRGDLDDISVMPELEKSFDKKSNIIINVL